MIRFRKESLKHLRTIVRNFRFYNLKLSQKYIILFLFIQSISIPTILHASEKVAPKSTTITLYWTATGDDKSSGRASYYDIRYALTPITNQNWEYTQKVKSVPSPQFSGSSESVLVYGLTPNTNYYFALKVGDEFPNWSTLSNVAILRTSPPPICGDLDESGMVDITDLVHLVKFMFFDTTPVYNLKAIDFDFSETVDISDLMIFVEYMFENGRALDCPN